jgi:hypothetical protein
MRRLLRTSTLVGLAGLAACAGPPSGLVVEGDTLIDPTVAIGDAFAQAGTGDPYEFGGPPRVSGDTLSVTVRFGGGCARHAFALRADNRFMESFPVQVALAVLHAANGDRCKARLTRELRFDLTPLRRAYHRSYGNGAGVMVLRLAGYSDGIRYTFGSA